MRCKNTVFFGKFFRKFAKYFQGKMKERIELLAPAKDFLCGKEAIKHGADAVYIGAPKFGARASAGNSVADIEKLVNFAHLFGVKIYVALNTIIFDHELDEVRRTIFQLYNAGVDALIIQDLGILQLDIPPIELHASTQTDIRSVEKAKFLEKCGFSRIVLARELSLKQISEIRKNTAVELEAFIHGALCVSYSGQCYMSQACAGRSANRGECAQFCRLPYSLLDAEGKILTKNRHLLSLKDLDQTANLSALIASGVKSLKIEGRLKDLTYVKNITAHYRQKLDAIFENDGRFQKSSAGKSRIFFEPNPAKTFHRESSEFFLNGRKKSLAQFDTPKSTGEFLGKVKLFKKKSFLLNNVHEIANGDGLCYVDKFGVLQGMRVNKVENGEIFPAKMPENLTNECKIFRNFNKSFDQILQKESAERKVEIAISLHETADGFLLKFCDEEGVCAEKVFAEIKQEAEKKEAAKQNIISQLSKLGNTIFTAKSVEISTNKIYFIPSSKLTFWKTEIVKLLEEKRLDFHKAKEKKTFPKNAKTPINATYLDNIANEKAKEFYILGGSEKIESAFEIDAKEKKLLMQCKYCLKKELSWCPKDKNAEIPDFREPLFLQYKEKKFRLKFDCAKCEMLIFSE